jgi:predicted  nucleic acid-binding Zn ribbon protein
MERTLLAEITFGLWPQSPSAEWLDELDQAYEGLISNLLRSGQIIGEARRGVVGGEVRAYVRVPWHDSLEPRFFTCYGERNWEQCTTLFGREPTFRMLDGGDSTQEPADWRKAPWLVLAGSYLFGLAPVRDHAGAYLPNYLFPLEAREMEGLYFWANDGRRLSGLWFSGVLEEQTLREMADPLSPFNLAGHRRSREVEAAVGKPVYLELFRHYQLPGDEESTRPCPLCGQPWKVVDEYFAFRCEPCRIVCDLGPGEDENGWASIGAWQGVVLTRPAQE